MSALLRLVQWRWDRAEAEVRDTARIARLLDGSPSSRRADRQYVKAQRRFARWNTLNRFLIEVTR